MIVPRRSCRIFYPASREGACMTATLISLALAGLVLIIVWEGLS
jgi:hypothetical protein